MLKWGNLSRVYSVSNIIIRIVTTYGNIIFLTSSLYLFKVYCHERDYKLTMIRNDREIKFIFFSLTIGIMVTSPRQRSNNKPLILFDYSAVFKKSIFICKI